MYATIHTIEPFDASVGTTVRFSWTGNQIYKVRCIIKNNETSELVYDETISTMKQAFEIPSNSGLVNGIRYISYITVFDVDGNESDLQYVGTPFYCFTTPVFNLSVNQDDIVKSSTYRVSLTYLQNENEKLDSYNIILYSYQKTELQTSGIQYDTSDMYLTLTGLENATQYYVKAIGTTVNGMILETEEILFMVSYQQAQIFTVTELNNKPEIGAIEFKANIVSTKAETNSNPEFIDGKYLNLTNNTATFDTGFKTSGDFYFVANFYDPILNKRIAKFTDKNAMTVELYYREGSFSSSYGTQCYIELIGCSSFANYTIYSNYVDIPTDIQILSVLVRRISGYYDIALELIERK